MADLQYNFWNDMFTVYEPVKEPETKSFTWQNILDNDPFEMKGFSSVSEDGKIPIVLDTVANYIVDNNSTPHETIQVAAEQPVQEQPVLTRTNPEVPVTKKINPSSKELYVMLGLINRGLKEHEAAGIVGNLIEESNLNTSVTADDVGQIGGALAGWRGENLTKLKLFAKNKNKPWTDIDVLLDYLVSTITPDVRKRLNNSRNPHEASEAWAYYEKYAGYNNDIGSARKFLKYKGWNDERMLKWIRDNHSRRSSNAQRVYDLWKNS